jgi:hypothetical protein
VEGLGKLMNLYEKNNVVPTGGRVFFPLPSQAMYNSKKNMCQHVIKSWVKCFANWQKWQMLCIIGNSRDRGKAITARKEAQGMG